MTESTGCVMCGGQRKGHQGEWGVQVIDHPYLGRELIKRVDREAKERKARAMAPKVIHVTTETDTEDGLDVTIQVRRPAAGHMIRASYSPDPNDVPPDIRMALRDWLVGSREP